jgi:hypothetical protein
MRVIIKSKGASSPSVSADLTVAPALLANREEYLMKSVDILRGLWLAKGRAFPDKIRVSCGFPCVGGAGSRGSKKILGSCWAASSAADRIPQIFISPMIDDTVTVIGTLAHELVHASAGHDEGHGPLFKEIAYAVGLRGKATSTVPSAELEEFIRSQILQPLGPYPHAKLNLEEAAKTVRKQTTRMLKCVCRVSGYTVRTTKQWIEKYGPPISPATNAPMEVEYPTLEEATTARIAAGP